MSDVKVTRMTAKRLRELRAWAERIGHVPSLELLAELDAVRAERDEAEARGAARERADVAALRAHSDELWEAWAQNDMARIGNGIFDLREEHRRIASKEAERGE